MRKVKKPELKTLQLTENKRKGVFVVIPGIKPVTQVFVPDGKDKKLFVENFRANLLRSRNLENYCPNKKNDHSGNMVTI